MQLQSVFNCWGSNLHGESDIPVEVRAHFILQASVGRHFVCILHNSQQDELSRQTVEFGNLLCWGDDSQDKLAIPSSLTRNNVELIKAGDWHSCAKGKVLSVCWGLNAHGQADIPSGWQHDTIAMSVRMHSSCFVAESLQVECFGKISQKQEQQDKSFVGFMQIELGQAHVCHNQERVICMGENEFEQLEIPAVEMTVMSLSTQANHTCAVDQSTVQHPVTRCWGQDDQGQAHLPASLANDDYQIVTLGEKHTCFVKGKYQVKCIGTSKQRLDSVPDFVLNNVQQVQAGNQFTCLIKGGELSCYGKQADKLNNIPARFKSQSEDVAAGFNHLCASFVVIGSSSTFECWSAKRKHSPGLSPPAGLTAQKWLNKFLTSGQNFSCSSVVHLQDKELKSAQCWGVNDWGQTDLPPALFAEAAPFMVSAGAAHTCALTDQHQLLCWGRNDKGQTGVPRNMEWNAGNLSAGQQHTCAVNQLLQGECWGLNNKGQCDVPAKVKQVLVKTTGGLEFSCGLDDTRRLTCWGGSLKQRTLPAGILAVKKVDSGLDHTCVITDHGTYKCFGGDDFGQSRINF